MCFRKYYVVLKFTAMEMSKMFGGIGNMGGIGNLPSLNQLNAMLNPFSFNSGALLNTLLNPAMGMPAGYLQGQLSGKTVSQMWLNNEKASLKNYDTHQKLITS